MSVGSVSYVASSFASMLPEAPSEQPKPCSLQEPYIHVELTHDLLDARIVMNRVRSSQAGAIVLFAGTKPVVVLVASYN